MLQIALRCLYALIAMIALAGNPASAQTGAPVDPRLGCDKAGTAPAADAGEPDTITPDVPGDGGSTAAGTDLESGSGSDSDDDGHNPPPAGAGQPM